MLRYVAFALLVASTLAGPAFENTNLDCLHHQDDIFSCLAVKAATTLERAARSADVTIIEGVTFVRETPVERSGKALKSETEVLAELPRATADKTLELATMLFESAVSFFKSHSLKINMPEGSVSRSLMEGRAKMKKMFLPVVAAIGIKILALVPIFLGGLALLVAKALVVGKVALLIAAVLGFQRLFNGGTVGALPSIGSVFNKSPSYYETQGSWSSNPQPSPSQGYYRSFDDKVDAQKLAYSAQAPNETD
ncbi:uncharacterized protein LOC106642570 [Copidosoma floridanum]|uniref:uncharacterized protein LOC106642570 n=1 Tax=Copidosoma floridanum TaxID=29053 RepID=UPI0006C95E5B|nr:uncharacterized protein LOC106642570 [Copidosoma floridanum]